MADDIAESAVSAHDVSTGGVAVTLAEMVGDSGVRAELNEDVLFDATPGRVVVAGDAEDFDGAYEKRRIGETTDDSVLFIELEGRSIELTRGEIDEARSSLEEKM